MSALAIGRPNCPTVLPNFDPHTRCSWIWAWWGVYAGTCCAFLNCRWHIDKVVGDDDTSGNYDPSYNHRASNNRSVVDANSYLNLS